MANIFIYFIVIVKSTDVKSVEFVYGGSWYTIFKYKNFCNPTGSSSALVKRPRSLGQIPFIQPPVSVRNSNRIRNAKN